MKNLVVFFSHAGETYFPDGYRVVEKGNAKIIAEKVQKLLQADIFEIETEKTYPIGYKECYDEALSEQKNGELPKLKKHFSGIESFDKVVIVYPCWWGSMPQAVFAFLNECDMSGKTIYPICTHEGSGLGKSESDLKKVCPNSTVVGGLAIRGATANSCDEKLKKYFEE